jgi:hypothetical protein
LTRAVQAAAAAAEAGKRYSITASPLSQAEQWKGTLSGAQLAGLEHGMQRLRNFAVTTLYSVAIRTPGAYDEICSIGTALTFIKLAQVRPPRLIQPRGNSSSYRRNRVENRVEELSAYSDAKKIADQSLRVGFRVGNRSRGCFATPADFPRHDCSPYPGLHVRRECL